MIPIVFLLIVVVLSLLVVRVATVALTLTGLSEQLARFQARSAFTGAGFTTSESERVVQHPVRRRIIMALMLLGNAGFITAVSSLIVSFVSADSSEGLLGAVWFRTTVMVFGLAALWFLAHTDWVDRWLSKWITSVLHRWTDLEVRDYASLLHLSGDYAVAEKVVTDDNWLADRPLKSLRLNDEGVLVLGIEKADGSYLGAPRGKYVLSTGDTVIFYGPRSVLADLDVRRAGREGNWEHHLAVERHLQHAAAEEQMLEGQHPDDDSEHSSETDSDQGRTRAARTRTELPPSEKRERSTDRTDRRAAKAW